MCEVGTYNQELYGIPYIPISKLFDISSDKLIELYPYFLNTNVTQYNFLFE